MVLRKMVLGLAVVGLAANVLRGGRTARAAGGNSPGAQDRSGESEASASSGSAAAEPTSHASDSASTARPETGVDAAAAAVDSPNPAERIGSTPMAVAATEVGTALADSEPQGESPFGSSAQRGPSSPSPGLPDFFRGA